MQRAVSHDDSKLGPPELAVYARAVDKFEKHRFGSAGYKRAKKSIDSAVQHHYKHNRHHPEHFNDGIDAMSLVDLIEMLCDWKSATLNHPENPGNMQRSLKLATEKYKISPQLVRVLYNTMLEYDLL